MTVPIGRIAAVSGAVLASALAAASLVPMFTPGEGSGPARSSIGGYDAEAATMTKRGIERISARVGELRDVDADIVATNVERAALDVPEVVPCAKLQRGDEAVLPPDELEGRTAVCGYIDVPERYDEARPSSIRLAYVLLKSEASNPAPTASIHLAGGPGQGSTGLLAGALTDPDVESVAERLRTERDVVYLDQRGTGASVPSLGCAPSSITGVPTEGDTATVLAEIDACRDTLVSAGADLSAYTTLQNSIDQFVVRTALRYPQVILIGTSYGAKLAYQSTRWNTGWIERVVASSPLSGENYLDVQPRSFQDALDAVYEDCAAQKLCASTYGDVSGALDAATSQLIAAPREVAFTRLHDGRPASIALDGSSFSTLVYLLLHAGLAEHLPAVATLAARGDLVPAATFLDALDAPDTTVARGMQLSVLCAEEARASDPDEKAQHIEDAQSVVRSFFSVDTIATECDAWDVPGEDPAAYAPDPADGDAEILILAGNHDPITPPEFGEEIVDANSDARVVVGAAAGHDPLTALGTCGSGIVSRYLDGADLRPGCASKPVEFEILPAGGGASSGGPPPTDPGSGGSAPPAAPEPAPTTPNPAVPSAPAPSAPAPSAPAPSAPAPSVPAPSFPAPDFPAPSFPAPDFPAPTFPTPSWGSPSWGTPSWFTDDWSARTWSTESSPPGSWLSGSWLTESRLTRSWSADSWSAGVWSTWNSPF